MVSGGHGSAPDLPSQNVGLYKTSLYTRFVI